MPRTRTYDPEQALDRAVRVFWERGYRDTSIRDLVEGTGVQRYGLYESWGDKHGLFLAALRRYEQVWVSNVLGDAESEHASLPELLGVFERLRAAVEPIDAPPGCLLCNTATELGEGDPEASRIVGHYVARLERAFTAALRRALERGEVGRPIDPEAHARFLTGVVLGACVYTKTTAGADAVRALIDTAVATLE